MKQPKSKNGRSVAENKKSCDLSVRREKNRIGSRARYAVGKIKKIHKRERHASVAAPKNHKWDAPLKALDWSGARFQESASSFDRPFVTPTDNNDTELHLTCLHEAGHAVIAHVKGFYADSIKILPDVAKVCYDFLNIPGPTQDVREMIISQIVVSMSGAVSTCLLGQSGPLRFDRREGGDGQFINNCFDLLTINGDHRRRLRRQLLEISKNLVAYHGSVIRELAKAIEPSRGIPSPIEIYRKIHISMKENRCTQYLQPPQVLIAGTLYPAG